MTAITGGFMFLIGMVILMTLWSPLVAVLMPFLDNTDTVAMGGIIKMIVTMVPAIVAFIGIVILANEAFGQKAAPPGYGY